MPNRYYELGFEVRMRLLCAFLSGAFGVGCFASALLKDTGGIVIFGAISIALTWLATNNKMFIRN